MPLESGTNLGPFLRDRRTHRRGRDGRGLQSPRRLELEPPEIVHRDLKPGIIILTKSGFDRPLGNYEPSTASLLGVAVSTNPTFTPGRSEPVPYEPNNFSSAPKYDIHPDGDRFLSLRDAAVESTIEGHLVVVVNWAEELKARLR